MRLLKSVLITTLLACAGVAVADSYPSRPITFLNNSIGAPEAIQRALFEVVNRNTGANLVMAPRPGGGGSLALRAVKAAPADGYTFGITYASAINLNPIINEEFGISPMEDFIPVIQLFNGGNVLIAKGDSPYKDLRDLVAAAKEKPDTIPVGVWGAGNKATLAELAEATGARFMQVPYRTSPEMVAAVMGGFLHAAFETVGTVVAHPELKALVYGGGVVSPQLGGVPVMRDLYGVDSHSWWGVIAPKGTPDVAVQWLRGEFVRALADPKIQTLIASNGFEKAGTEPEKFAAFLERELKVNQEIVRKYPDVR